MIQKTKILLFSIGISLCLGAFVFAKLSTSDLVQTVTKPAIEHEFNAFNFNVMNVDSFSKILTKAYPENSSLSQKANQFIIQISGGDLSQFYNQNSELLKVNRKGFDIQIHEGVLTASFNIEKNAIQVPNDVLINLAKHLQGL